ncbi:MAG TPA: hypothetical protein PK079_25540 [Leptospiraceae bacterium]|nr:hypothetical protein [Leptospiraceae bacterium]HMW08469.1 hypothetical protein [Leptospiraceae bacterium]HMX33948.1 hypothetical protein [Leptospiraceae bacterium]HMY34229.1 hypothetical protein [Leptospiraceae bacterium]HMZ66754.1 hypothetical protein [Leptospiraceae bacterium]
MKKEKEFGLFIIYFLILFLQVEILATSGSDAQFFLLGKKKVEPNFLAVKIYAGEGSLESYFAWNGKKNTLETTRCENDFYFVSAEEGNIDQKKIQSIQKKLESVSKYSESRSKELSFNCNTTSVKKSEFDFKVYSQKCSFTFRDQKPNVFYFLSKSKKWKSEFYQFDKDTLFLVLSYTNTVESGYKDFHFYVSRKIQTKELACEEWKKEYLSDL